MNKIKSSRGLADLEITHPSVPLPTAFSFLPWTQGPLLGPDLWQGSQEAPRKDLGGMQRRLFQGFAYLACTLSTGPLAGSLEWAALPPGDGSGPHAVGPVTETCARGDAAPEGRGVRGAGRVPAGRSAASLPSRPVVCSPRELRVSSGGLGIQSRRLCQVLALVASGEGGTDTGSYFASHFIMGGEKFDSTHPEGYLFGENSDLNFLGNRPVA
ncbi:hypothetical protein DBR06_SOUSAS4110205, partial [Sousa chinensis]